MKTIPLTRGQSALVDDEDYDSLAVFRWNAQLLGGSYYATRRDGDSTILMHRQIMGLLPGDAREVDHKETTRTLDNQRSNLRIAHHMQNMYHRGKNKNNKSGFKGVSWSESKGVWVAQICANRKQIYVGVFHSKEEAAIAYADAAQFYHGEFTHRSVLCQKEFCLTLLAARK